MRTSHERDNNPSHSSARECASLLVLAWTAVQRWLAANTCSPAWLKSRWHYPMVSYLVAVLFQGIVIVVMKVLLQAEASLSVSAMFMIGVVVLTAGTWGAGPSLFAAASGTILLDFFSGPFLFPLLPSRPPDMLAVVLLLVVGLSMSRLATGTEIARRRADALNIALHTSEQEARARSRELEATFEAIADAVFVHDTQEQLHRINPAAHAIFDLEKQSDAPSRSGEEHTALFRFRDEHGQPLAEELWPLRRILSGREVQYHTSGAPIHDEKQHIIGVVLTMRDVTARRQLEQRTQEALNDLVDVSSFQADMLEIHLEVCNLAAIVCEIVEEQRQIVPSRTISMPIISVERVLVRDQGPGLSASQQVRIWERFHRAPGIEVQSGSSIGLGLGLHISRTIIERHHGQVGVESSSGMGATFWFTLPLASPGTQSLRASNDFWRECSRAKL